MYQAIRSDMIFKGDKFRLEGQRIIFTAQEEPTITGPTGNETVSLRVRMTGNKYRQLRLKYGTIVYVWNNGER